MATNHKTVEVVLSADLATSGTFNVTYPQGTSRTTFIRGKQHAVSVGGGGIIVSPGGIGVSLGATAATVTYRGAATIPAGTRLLVMLDAGGSPRKFLDLPPRVKAVGSGGLYLVELGNPIASAANNICASQAVLAATVAGAVFASTLQVGGVVTLDVPRALVAAWTSTAVLTVDGFDEYGAAIREQSASGTALTGVKAFKTVTRVTVSADVTGLTVGTGKVLGMPCFLSGAANVIREAQDLAVATAGTVVAGLSPATVSTATTADVRGTYAPNGTPDGSIAFALLCWLEDPAHRGNPQFAG